MISPGIGVELFDNLVAEPAYLDRDAQGLPPVAGQPVLQLLAGLAATWASVDVRPGCSGVPVTPQD